MEKKPGRYLKYILSLIAVAAATIGILAYRGNYLGQEKSPNGVYSLKYYGTFNPFKMQWSMPGGSPCKPRWVRIFDGNGHKLNELLTTDCSMEMDAIWIGNQVILPDGKTIWELPDSSE